MLILSTREAAKKLGIDHSTLTKYLVSGKLPSPKTIKVGKKVVHLWTEPEIVHARKLLPRIANGRKTRYKKQSALSNQQSPKTKAQARVPAPHRKSKPKKK